MFNRSSACRHAPQGAAARCCSVSPWPGLLGRRWCVAPFSFEDWQNDYATEPTVPEHSTFILPLTGVGLIRCGSLRPTVETYGLGPKVSFLHNSTGVRSCPSSSPARIANAVSRLQTSWPARRFAVVLANSLSSCRHRFQRHCQSQHHTRSRDLPSPKMLRFALRARPAAHTWKRPRRRQATNSAA